MQPTPCVVGYRTSSVLAQLLSKQDLVKFILGQPFKARLAEPQHHCLRVARQTQVASMPEYKFKIGETVYFYPKAPNDAPRGAYQIIRRLPAAEGDFQYVIRSMSEEHQRIAKESELRRY